jgi:hypothetical protein
MTNGCRLQVTRYGLLGFVGLLGFTECYELRAAVQQFIEFVELLGFVEFIELIRK